MRRATLAGLLLVTCVVAARPAHADSSRVVLRVVVNEVDMGDRFVSRLGPDDFGLPAAELRLLGLRLPHTHERDSAIVSLRSLAPGVRFRLDEPSATLFLTAAPELLPSREIALGTRNVREATPLNEDSAFLNYAVSHTIPDRAAPGSWSVPLEAGLRSRGWLALSTLSGTVAGGTRRLIRLGSSLTHDDPRTTRRIIVGDAAVRPGAFGSAAIVGGIHIATEFALAPDLEITPRQEIEGLLEAPSDVELRVNGALVRRDRLPPGGFRYSDLPLDPGAGEVTLSVRDAFGGMRTIHSPYYRSTSLLEPGLADYGWSLGFERRSFGLRSFDYGTPVVIGTHRVGWSRATTIGLGVEARPDRVLLSPALSHVVGSMGELHGALAVSQGKHGIGGAWLVTGRTSTRRASVDLAVEGASARFASRPAAPGAARPQLGISLGASWSSRLTGSISMRASRAITREGRVDGRVSASWSRRIARSLSLVGRVQRARGPRPDVEASVMVTTGLGPSRSAGLDIRHSAGGDGVTFHLQQSPAAGPGFDYRVQASQGVTPDGRPLRSGTVVTHYQGSRGQLGATRIQAIDAGSWELTASGSIARVGGSFFLGRPVRDGFAVVRVPGMRGVPVLVRHQSLGVTDGRGALFVPSLTSHDANSIALDDRSLPADWNLVQRERWVSPPFRGGGIVEFEARRFQSVEGRILLVRNGLATPAEYAGFEVETGSATMRSIVGRNGFFYFENLPAGEHRARIHLGREEGRFVLRVPRTDATTVDLGEIRCEADAIGVLHP